MTTFRILITGSREWADKDAVRRALGNGIAQVLCTVDWEDHADLITVVHGDARGADRIAAQIASEMGCEVEPHPADWNTYGRSAGHRRNAEMVALGADICLAFPIGESRGTRGCMALAAKAGIPVVSHEGVAA
jgi:hypothetical protein